MSEQAQSLAVKRAEVEFHQFAAMGEPERAFHKYETENARRGPLLRKHLDYIEPLSPFLEIGANIGHTSYLLCNEFGGRGFALDLSADALRFGPLLQERWGMPIEPFRLAGDALRLPFRDGSLRFVMACQMLSQFMDIEQVVLEVKRVLAPGGVFFFCEEPLRRALSLRLYRCPYEPAMKPWERKLYDWGLLGYLVQDVIGAGQEESFGIRQNHTMTLPRWHALVTKHFASFRYEIFVPERGWGERVVKRGVGAYRSDAGFRRAARLLGGTLAAFCKKEGEASVPASWQPADLLQCPDCGAAQWNETPVALQCRSCQYVAESTSGVYNLLPSKTKAELYPGVRPDILDFSQPEHESGLIEGFYDLEGVFGNRYRWIGPRASVQLRRVDAGPQKLRIRGFATREGRIAVSINGQPVETSPISREGLFIVEAPVPDSPSYTVVVEATPVWHAPGDARALTVNLSMIRLLPV